MIEFRDKFLGVKHIALPSNYSYITHHARVYGNVPLWVATNALTFGQISKMYQYSTSDIRTKVSLNFANMSEVQLHQLIRILASCRNVCAHNERLYSFKVNEAISDMVLHSKLQISQKNCPHISQELLFSKMGFPENWDKIARYKK
ncbi:MAG: Abi family protein [Eubacteriales bacterium]|nr:Abi family protein [Eubacteriales bacterium]